MEQLEENDHLWKRRDVARLAFAVVFGVLFFSFLYLKGEDIRLVEAPRSPTDEEIRESLTAPNVRGAETLEDQALKKSLSAPVSTTDTLINTKEEELLIRSLSAPRE